MIPRRSSGSSRADRGVEPTRSQNITVSWRRSALSGGGAEASFGLAAAQYVRKLAPYCRAKQIYRALDADAGETALTAFEEGCWGKKYPAIGQSWRRAWAEVVPFYAFPTAVRRILYTTDEIDKDFRLAPSRSWNRSTVRNSRQPLFVRRK